MEGGKKTAHRESKKGLPTLAGQSGKLARYLGLKLKQAGYNVKKQTFKLGNPSVQGNNHTYLVVSKKGKKYILDPGLSDAIKSVYGRTIVPKKKNPMWIAPVDSGLSRPYYQTRRGVFTPEEHAKIRGKLAQWKQEKQKTAIEKNYYLSR